MVLVLFILAQLVVAAGIVFVLKKVLDNMLAELALRQFELVGREKKSLDAPLVVITHKGLNAKQEQRIVQVALKQFGAAAKPSFQVDRSLLGGMVIKVGSYLIDCSLKDRLRRASQR